MTGIPISVPLVLHLACCVVSDSAYGDNWPGWRGSTGQGVCHETNLPVTWSTTDNVRWKVPLPVGYSSYIYNWCPNLGTRYTTMRTPLFVETQVKRLAANRIQSVYRDGPGDLYGLEGPTYYTMGRMFGSRRRKAECVAAVDEVSETEDMTRKTSRRRGWCRSSTNGPSRARRMRLRTPSTSP